MQTKREKGLPQPANWGNPAHEVKSKVPLIVIQYANLEFGNAERSRSLPYRFLDTILFAILSLIWAKFNNR